MNCSVYETYDTGKLAEDEFIRHAEHCSACRALLQEDDRLLQAAALLREPVDTAGAWPMIEARLRGEMSAAAARTHKSMVWFLRAAAVLVLAVALARLFAPGWPASSELLPKSALVEVEQAEQAYERSISRLEQEAAPRLESMDTELALLYRDKLETVDRQISRCREALRNNPGNAHIRRYMLAALKDKKQTLRAVLKGDSHQI